MYLRILAIIGIFNMTLARRLALPMCALSAAAFAISALQYWIKRPQQRTTAEQAAPTPTGGNPLELGAAVAFAVLFIATSLLSSWATKEFGVSGIYSLAAVVGISDIDPFVLNLAQGGLAGVSVSAIASAILIAASSNNVLKAFFAVFFAGGRATASSAAALVFLAAAGVVVAVFIGISAA